MVERVISGGQTGVDQAGIAVAKRLGIATGGYMPKSWLTEAGPRPDVGMVYGVHEVETEAYPDGVPCVKPTGSFDWIAVKRDDQAGLAMPATKTCGQHGAARAGIAEYYSAIRCEHVPLCPLSDAGRGM